MVSNEGGRGEMVQVLGYTFSRLSPDTLPPGRALELPGRGTTYLYEEPGPPGAPTLVLIHGLGASGALNWFPAFGPLSERFHVIAVDLRGHGRGIPVRGRYRLSDCADDVAALADVVARTTIAAPDANSTSDSTS